MDLRLVPETAYRSASQIARVSTEKWTLDNFYCASCGAGLTPYPTNTPLYDFHSPECKERFQLKASRNRFGNSVLDSEYHTALDGVMRDAYPSLILLRYDPFKWAIVDVELVHRAFITTRSLVPRKALSANARRAGWQGCMISLISVPALGRIEVVKNGVVRPKMQVLNHWKQSNRLLEAKPQARGWLADILRCVDQLYSTFTIENLYSFEAELAAEHPENHFVRPKIRQQLQILRDLGLIEFVSRGVYRRLGRPTA
ncbi:MAG: restriction endonuclease [Nitrososphaerota archaeon]|nr:restriction endonuclease [Nitrososphaerota archaeon]